MLNDLLAASTLVVFLVWFGTAVIALVNGQRANRSYLKRANELLDRIDDGDGESTKR